MDNKIILDLDLFKNILEEEVKKLTGITMKRFELSDNKEDIKKQVKEVQYEWARNFYDRFKTAHAILLINSEPQKKE